MSSASAGSGAATDRTKTKAADATNVFLCCNITSHRVVPIRPAVLPLRRTGTPILSPAYDRKGMRPVLPDVYLPGVGSSGCGRNAAALCGRGSETMMLQSESVAEARAHVPLAAPGPAWFSSYP